MLSFLKTKQSCSKCRALSIWRWLASTLKLNAKQIFKSLVWLQPCTPIDCYPKKNLAPQSLSSLSLSLSQTLPVPASTLWKETSFIRTRSWTQTLHSSSSSSNSNSGITLESLQRVTWHDAPRRWRTLSSYPIEFSCLLWYWNPNLELLVLTTATAAPAAAATKTKEH